MVVRQDREDGCRTTVEFHRREGRFSAVQPERGVDRCLDVVDTVMRVECRERSADSEGIRERVAVRSAERRIKVERFNSTCRGCRVKREADREVGISVEVRVLRTCRQEMELREVVEVCSVVLSNRQTSNEEELREADNECMVVVRHRDCMIRKIC